MPLIFVIFISILILPSKKESNQKMEKKIICNRCQKEFEPFFGLAKDSTMQWIRHEDLFGNTCYDCLTEEEKVNFMSLATSFLVSDELKKQLE
jgi:hypothetical protein